MAPKKPSLFFDIEAGGLSGHRSSIFSISHGTTPQNIQTSVAHPEPGTFMSSWSKKNVWEPIKGTPNKLSEKDMLSNFLGVLKQHDEVAGWNIGYTPTAQSIDLRSGPRGFDIPMLLTRAKAHGLHKEYEEQFSRLKIRDIGREKAVDIAREVVKYPELVDPDLFKQVQSFAKMADIKEHVEHVPRSGLAKALSNTGYEMAGWKQESVAKLMGMKYQAHQSEHDIAALMNIVGHTGKMEGPEFVSAWHSEALKNRLVSAAFAGAKGKTDFPGGSFIGGLESRAEKFNILGDFQASLRSEAKSRGADIGSILAGLGHTESFSRVRAPFRSEGMGFLKSFANRKVAIGAAVLGAALILKPLSLFSAKDDEYNTIEGLPHGGTAEHLRKLNTDFGSGYRGLFAREERREDRHKTIDKWLHRAQLANSAVLGYAGLTSRNIGFDDRLSQMFGKRGGGLAHHTGTAIWAAETVLKVYDDPSAKTVAKIGLGWAGWEAGLKAGTKLGGLIGERVGHKGLAGLLGHVAGHFAANAAYNLIPGDDDSYNTIEGLPHGGQGQVMRKKLTEFGSGWDKLTALLRAGEKLETVVAGKEFQAALGTAKQGKLLGEGWFGKAHQMEGEFRGQSFSFVRKTGEIGDHEVAAMKSAQSSIGPNVYSHSDKHIDMEHFQGKTLADLHEHLNDRERAHVMDMVHTAKFKGYSHNDLNSGNIMFMKEGENVRMGIIDFGNAIPGKDDAYNTIPGLLHGGFAQKMRKLLTDFGSGWIRKAFSKGVNPVEIAAGIAKTGVGLSGKKAGAFFEEALDLAKSGKVTDLVKMTRAAQNIKGASGASYLVEQKLGQGGFGEVFGVRNLQSGKLGVLKRELGESVDLAAMQAEGRLIVGPALGGQIKGPLKYNPIKQGEALDYAGRYAKEMQATGKTFGVKAGTLEYEARMQEAAHKQLGQKVPSVMDRVEGHGFIQERGTPLKGDSEKVAAARFIKREYAEMYKHSGGVAHYDPHLGNVVRSGGKFQIVDWGLSAVSTKETSVLRNTIGMESVEAYTHAQTAKFTPRPLSDQVATGKFTPPNASPSVLGKKQKTANIDKSAWVKNHKSAMQQSSRNALAPGQGHKSYTVSKKI